jgi:hypothetical protein
MGSRLGGFLLHITLHRTGRGYEVQARIHDSAGDFHCRARQNDWRHALRDLIRSISGYLHRHCLHQASFA